MKRIIIFGTVHQFQENGHFLNPELEQRLKYLSDKLRVTIVMEEWSADRAPSFAGTRAACWQVQYANIGTPSSDEGFKTLVPAEIYHPGHCGTLRGDEDAPRFCEYGPLDKQENRERRMAENTRQAMESHEVGLLVVGLAHLHSMSMRLKGIGFDVAAYLWIEIVPART